MSTHTLAFETHQEAVFLVDDEFLVVESLGDMISRLGWVVSGKSYDTEKAFHEIVGTLPDIVLADIRFAGDENAGIELVSRFRDEIGSRGHQIPFVIFITGLGEDGLVAASEIPFSTVLQKPLKQNELKADMEAASRRVRGLRQLRDAQWALRSLANGEFNEYEGDFVGVYKQKVVSTGNDETLVRQQVSKSCSVQPDEVVVEYKGELS